MHENIIEDLYEKFNLSTRQGTGGMTFKYVPNEDVINRMNTVFKGDWSTYVKFRDIVDDQVILEVEVKVVDPDTQMTHSHTGFGSQQIMRYNSGPNQGKIIDIGNGYKGALAKAIVNACTRWGVGLFKENDPAGPVEMPSVPTMQSQLPSVSTPTPMPPVQPPAPDTATAPMPVMPTTTADPMPAPPITTTAPAMVMEVPTVPMPAVVAPPPTMAVPPMAETTTTFPPPVHPDQPVVADLQITQAIPTAMPAEIPKIPAPIAGTPQAPPVSPAGGLDSVNISDVQKVALNGLLTMNNANYDELAVEAFQANGMTKAVPPREKLSYEEAVTVIKFGNEKYRKNR